MTVLSILICSLPERENQLKRLLKILDEQINKLSEKCVEYIVDCAPRGIMTTGQKRNSLLMNAKGEYICYIDDDDIVSNDYVEKILEALKTKPDCVGLVGVLKRPGQEDWTFRHSITVERWCSDQTRKIYFRTPNHLNPVRRILADTVAFKNITVGEDHDYSNRLKPLLKTEVFIEGIIYFYLK